MSDTAADFRMHELRGIDWGEMGGSRTASGVRVNADTLMACSAYTACIRVISDSVSSLPLHLYERLPNGGKRKASEHPIYRLLHQQPNPWQTAQEFRDWMTGLYLHYGASYAEIRAGARGPVSELWPLHSSRMEVERLENGRLRYIYREPDGRRHADPDVPAVSERHRPGPSVGGPRVYVLWQRSSAGHRAGERQPDSGGGGGSAA